MKPTSMCVVAMWVALAGLCLPRPVGAQSSEANGQLRRHPTVYVTDASGQETKGKLLSWIASEISVETDAGPRTFRPGEAVRLDVGGDSLKNGALIGLIAGVAMGALVSAGCDCDNVGLGIFAISTGMYTLMGVGVDAMVQGRTPVWSAGQSRPQRTARNGLTFRLSPERRSAFVGWRVK
jgi:hypothetical protein